MNHILIVLNNKSGTKKAKSYLKLIYKAFKKTKIKYKFVWVSVLPSLKNIQKYDTVIVVGGDGTVNAVLPLIVNTDKVLGIIPAGTANLLAANLQIPFKASKALRVILNRKTSRIDAALAGERYFVLRLGFGYDADIIKDAPQVIKSKVGYFAYLWEGFIKIFTLKNKSYKVKLDDEKLFVSAGTIIIANAGNMFKNIFTIAPKGTLDDGKLDVFIRRTSNVFASIEVFLRIIFKNFQPDSKVIYAQAKKITVKTDNTDFHIDGEQCKNNGELNIEVLPKALKVFVP